MHTSKKLKNDKKKIYPRRWKTTSNKYTKSRKSQALVTHACDLSYSGGRGQEARGSNLPPGK
jgi:hypothetical protein